MGGTELYDFVWEVQSYKTLYGRCKIIRFCTYMYRGGEWSSEN